MASSTQHIDDLLEWVPGPPAAASVSVIAALAWGARRALQAGWLMVLLWLAYFLLAAGGLGVALEVLRVPTALGGAFGSLLAVAGGGMPTAMSLADAVWQATLAGSSARRLFMATPWYLLFYGVLAGGVINWLRAPRPAPLLAQLGAACGWYTGRFLRLLVLAALLSALLTRWLGPLIEPGAPGLRPIALLALLSVLPAAIIDWARVRSVVRDSRSMLLEVARSARFFARNLPRLVLLELCILALGAGAGLLAVGLAAATGRIVAAPVAAAAATQFLVLALLWLRLVAWGAMLSLHQGLTLERLQER